MNKLITFCKKLLREESGQAISEYAAILAAAALAIAVLAASSGCYKFEVSRAFRNATNQVGRMAGASKKSSSLPQQPYRFIG